jgi:hypothetical protein
VKRAATFFNVGIMAGRQHIAVELYRTVEQEAEFDELVAGDTWRRRAACRIFADKRVNHFFLEAILRVDDVMADTECRADFLCAGDIFERTAA